MRLVLSREDRAHIWGLLSALRTDDSVWVLEIDDAQISLDKPNAEELSQLDFPANTGA